MVGWFDATRRSNRQLVRFRRIAPGTTAFEPTTYTVTWPSRGSDSPFRSQIEVATRGEQLDVVVYDRADSSGDGIVWHRAWGDEAPGSGGWGVWRAPAARTADTCRPRWT